MSRASPSCSDERVFVGWEVCGKDHLLVIFFPAIFDIVQFRQRKGFSPRNQVPLVPLKKGWFAKKGCA